MADWTTGRGRTPAERGGPSAAQIAREEFEATLRAQAQAKTEASREGYHFSWIETSKRGVIFKRDPKIHALRTEERKSERKIHKIAGSLDAALRERSVWAAAAPTTSKERRRAKRALVRLDGIIALYRDEIAAERNFQAKLGGKLLK